MVKVKIRDQSQEKKSRKQLILPIFLGAVMVMSTFGYIFGKDNNDSSGSDGQSAAFGSFTFKKTGAGWVTQINGRDMVFRYLPSELTEIDVPFTASFLQNNKVYLTRDSSKNYGTAERDIYSNLKPILNLNLACTQDSEACRELPIKTCKDAGEQVTVILLEIATKQEVTSTDNCITVRGDAVYVSKAVDKLLYSNFGVI